MILFAAGPAMAAENAQVQVSAASTPEQAGLVDMATVSPGVRFDIRYAGEHNFVGARVTGYDAPRCMLLAPVAQALARVQDEVQREGLTLKVFDCYRPVRAVRHFVRWAEDAGDQRTKPAYYPALDKSKLLDGYIAETSGHSRGATLDLTLARCDGVRCTELDMGTPFDFFDPSANTLHPQLTPDQARNRERLVQAMARHGFRNYPMEWWHYTLQPEPTPTTAYDVPIE